MADKQAVATVQLENEHLRVTEWRFTPGAATGYHRHAYDYVVVPVVDGELELVGPDGGRSRAQLEQAMSGVLCRCFTHVRMLAAIERYARGRANE